MSRLSGPPQQSILLAQQLIVDSLKPITAALATLHGSITSIQLAASIFNTYGVANDGVEPEAALKHLAEIAERLMAESRFLNISTAFGALPQQRQNRMAEMYDKLAVAVTESIAEFEKAISEEADDD